MASKVSPHSTRGRKLTPASKSGVPVPEPAVHGLAREDIMTIVETAMESAVQKIKSSIQDTVKTAVREMAATISQQLSSDLQTALRAINEDLERLGKRMKDCEERLKEVSEQPASTSEIPSLQLQAFNIDRLEQYSRRENVRIRGIPRVEGENTSQLVIDLAKECGVELSKTDISTSHRLQVKNPTMAPIICRFVRKEKKVELMKAKKILKSKGKKVFIDEDLTPLRARMFYALRNDPAVSAVWTMDGRLHCVATVSGREQKVVIDSPDDLFNLGWGKEKTKQFYT